MEVAELEAEKEHFCICIPLLYRDVGGCGGFASSVAKTATPMVKSQVSRRVHISYICIRMCVYVHIHTQKWR